MYNCCQETCLHVKHVIRCSGSIAVPSLSLGVWQGEELTKRHGAFVLQIKEFERQLIDGVWCTQQGLERTELDKRD